jgi:Protein of unknown function (DUF3455)
MSRTFPLSALTLIVVALSAISACTSAPMAPKFSQSTLPDAVKVPAGHIVAMETVGKGEITYECREKKDAAGQFEWAFVGPNAKLLDRKGAQIGTYYGPPATWQNNDGSKVTGAQVAVAPASAGNIPFQLVKANEAMGNGAMRGTTFIQRVATQGGVAPAAACTASNRAMKEVVPYQADYIFYRAT